MKKLTLNQKLIAKTIAIVLLTAITVTLHLLKNNAEICEWFATNFSRWWIFLFGNIFGVLPISAYELFLIVTIVYFVLFIVFVIKNLTKKQFKKALSMTLTLVVFLMSFVTVYTSTATMSYGRNSLSIDFYEYTPKNFELPQSQAEELIDTFVSNLNTLMNRVDRDAIGNTKLPYSISKMGDIIGQDYDRIFGENNYFSPFNVKVKPILNKRLMSEMHIYGVFFAPTGVASINPYTPTYRMGVTVAHEIAHGKGVMYESDADLVAFYVCLQSQDDYVRYSAYSAIYFYAISILSAYENTQDLITHYYSMIGRSLSIEWANNSEVWSKFTLLDDVGQFFNDLYLKLQGQEDGTDSYGTGKIPDTEIIENPDGTITEKIVYLSQIQRMLIQMYLDGKLQRI